MTLGLAAVSTKVPLVQPAADNRGILPDVEAGGRVVVGVVVGVGRVVGGVEGVVVVGRVVGVGVPVRWQATGS